MGRARNDSATLTSLVDEALPARPAIGGVAGPDLRYQDLAGAIARIAGQLGALGIERNDRVALVLPNGPEAAVLTLAVAACATAAPLNPKYTAPEFGYYLRDLDARLTLTLTDTPALSAGAPEGVRHVTVAGPLADLRLEMAGSPVPAEAPAFAKAEDVALVLHTSGTTSRPKQVPLTHRNLTVSAGNIRDTLDLTPEDRGLNVMPLFHIHGLVAGLFASIAAGAPVVCTPGFDALRFHRWLAEGRATWFTAVPTMYQLLLARSEGHSGPPLRFVRSSSASMPPTALTDSEALFGAPFIESYGMTEASHQMTANPLPPGERKLGSVGVDGRTEVRVMREDGSWADPGEIGEAVIRGGCVTGGYVANPEANAASFVDGWFRTGDQARLDDDGYLFLTGRLKEIINKGGTKISPRQIDEVLLAHPGVAQAVAFAIPDRWLGEEVAAAVVLRDGDSVEPADIRRFASERLVANRVPKKILIVPEIPKGPTGKLQRIGLARQLGLG